MPDCTLIEFSSILDDELADFKNLTTLSQRFNIASFKENQVSNLLDRLDKIPTDHKIFIEVSYEDIEVTKKMISGASIPVGMGMKCTVGDRMLVIGDAGGFVSPLSGEGLYYALDSGRIAAESLDVLFKEGNFDKQSMMLYHDTWSQKWGDDLEWLKVGWHLLMVMPNSLIRYAALDEETKEFFTHMFVYTYITYIYKYKCIHTYI